MTDLQDHLEDATSTTDLAGVYWCARDLSGGITKALGNHHFFLFVYADEGEAKALEAAHPGFGHRQVTNEKDLVVPFSSLGLGRSDGLITVHPNDPDDYQAVWEVADDDNRSMWTPDLDLEGHRIPPRQGSTRADLMHALLGMWKDYEDVREANQVPRIPYVLVDENCAAMVNTFLAALGYTSEERESLGEMDGIDWGEEDLIPMDLFSAMAPQLPEGTWTGIRHVQLVLSASCRRIDQTWAASTLDITYVNGGDIDNIDGTLVWRRDETPVATHVGGPYVPPGSYVSSAQDVTVTLRAECFDGTTWKPSELVLTNLRDISVLSANGGLAYVQT